MYKTSVNNIRFSISGLFLFVTGLVAVATNEDYYKRAADPVTARYFMMPDDMTRSESEAMEFLYAYMPLPDITDYSTAFYLDNVRTALKTRTEMPWGNSVPDLEFYHFVLPVRVNNENLDNSRMVFFEELKERVKGMSMADAALEVNHWCHEKVTYQPSDARTSSPFASVCSAIGRCGEESTFTVAALRSIGIPARQVYTPRWAHTDDNHAWVEVWIDGKWHFLGACEPEPILDLGWFNAPASRGMLMTTKAFGKYDGPEEKLGQTACYTEINVTDNYAPTDMAYVTVTDESGRPVEDATVYFCIYNYAEFYPVAVKKTDLQGRASLKAGLGDILVWASDGKRFNFAKVSVGKDKSLTLKLDKDSDFTGSLNLDIIPPAQTVKLPVPTPEAVAENDRRKIHEDSIRMSYTDTFYDRQRGIDLARRLGLDPDRVSKIMIDARGNYKTIEDFLSSENIDREKALDLLLALAEKDRRDVSREVLDDHIATPLSDNPLYVGQILNPRVSNEMLTPYKSYLRNAFSEDFRKSCVANPELWVEWCRDSIVIDDDDNPQNLCMSPRSVYDVRKTDAHSRDIFFVAGARSFGIPARIYHVTGKPQIADGKGDFTDVDFGMSGTMSENTPTGVFNARYTPVGRIDDPAYYYHFTLSDINGGLPHLLEYPDNTTLSRINGNGEGFAAGQYLMVSGQRMANGNVLAHMDIIKVCPDTVNSPVFTIRQDLSGAQVIGNFNSENLYFDHGSKSTKSLLSTTGRGYYILGLIAPGNEPSVHALNDISHSAGEFEKWGGKIMILFENDEAVNYFDKSRFGSLPSNVCFGNDMDGKIFNEIAENMKLANCQLPVFIIADTFNRIVFISQGYTIGLGEQMINILHKTQ